ncbi:MAG TPA: inositol monophosphatase family protein, partial [Steroidobacteraceae bacterium]|nr:inositol monophosphatase family protein [Steroidobacteraceae bacterium]
MPERQLKTLLDAAVAAAEAAAPVIRGYFGSQRIGLERKADGSPVTRADREAEAIIREKLAVSGSGDPIDILGEEEGFTGTGTRCRWTIDPIDGTRAFVRGIPLFGSMIGLEDTASGQALLGVIHLPVLGVTYAGAAGLGATRNGELI